MHKHPLKWYKQNPFEPCFYWLERAKQPSKSSFLGAKSWFLGLKKYGLASKIERQNGAKRSRCSQKRTEKEIRRAANCCKLHVFRPMLTLEWVGEQIMFCKIFYKSVSFLVNDLASC